MDGDGDERLQSAVVAGINEARQRSANSSDTSSSRTPDRQFGASEQHSEASKEAGHLKAEKGHATEPSADRQRDAEPGVAVNSGSRSSNG